MTDEPDPPYIAAAVAKHLASVLGLTYGDTNADVFVDRMPATPDECIGVFSTGGFSQPTRSPSDAPTVQVRCRGTERNSRQPRTTAGRVSAEMACLDLVWLDPDGPDRVFVTASTLLQSSPVGLGMDESERHEFAVNVALRTHAPTIHRPATATT